MNDATTTVLNGVSAPKEKNESDEKIHMNEDSHVHLFKRHKVYSSPKSDLHVDISQTPPSSNVADSIFVTPGIYKRKVCKSRMKESNNEAKFTWSVDELAILRPVQFDESEFSLPPDDWLLSFISIIKFFRNPNSNHDVEKYWSRNEQIFPSPDVQNIFWAGVDNYSKSSTSSSPGYHSHSSEDFYSSKYNWHNNTESSSNHSKTDKRFTPSENSQEDVLLFKLDSGNDEKEDEQEFEKIERSLSIGDDADRIFADLEYESGCFVMRQQPNSPIEVGEKYSYLIKVS